MAMLTPAQKPRGLARIIFTRDLRGGGTPLSYRGRAGPPSEAVRKRRRHPARGGGGGVSGRAAGAGLLAVLQLGDGDDVLAVLAADGALDHAVLAFLADVAVVLLVAVGVEVVQGGLVTLLDLDDGGALGQALDLEVALGAGDLPGEGNFLAFLRLFGGPEVRHQGDSQRETGANGQN